MYGFFFRARSSIINDISATLHVTLAIVQTLHNDNGRWGKYIVIVINFLRRDRFSRGYNASLKFRAEERRIGKQYGLVNDVTPIERKRATQRSIAYPVLY